MDLVLSVSGRYSLPFVLAHRVHACPDGPKNYNYRDTPYITFRDDSGEMRTIYGIAHVFTMLPDNAEALDRQPIDEAAKERVRGYIDARKAEWEFGRRNQPYRFYVLSEADVIHLPHRPRKEGDPGRGHYYFTLDELLSGKTNVTLASKMFPGLF